MMHTVDWYPTLLGLAGADLSPEKQKQPLDGMDMWKTISEGQPSSRNIVLMNTTPARGAIRVGAWKLVLNGNASDEVEEETKKGKKAANKVVQSVELYHLAEDPSEKNNLATKNPEKVQELRKAYNQLAKQAVPPRNGPKR